ncbi:MAG: YHS domain-containing protein [Syntrophales bacterium]|nr:YHS domain-containing protein [Syntrophales bacterium]
MAKDPVCGMTVKEEGVKSDYKGRTYFFCSEFCKNLFEEDQERYVVRLRSFAAPGTAKERSIGYFSMEIAVDSRIPTYSGGLGILAGDTLRSCADLKVPSVAVTLLYEKGYFYQKIEENGNQRELPVQWQPQDYLRRLSEKVEVYIEGERLFL